MSSAILNGLRQVGGKIVSAYDGDKGSVHGSWPTKCTLQIRDHFAERQSVPSALKKARQITLRLRAQACNKSTERALISRDARCESSVLTVLEAWAQQKTEKHGAWRTIL